MSNPMYLFRQIVAACIAAVIIAVLFLIAMDRIRSSGTLKMKVGNSEVSMDFKDHRLTIGDTIQKILENEAAAKEFQALLRDFGQFYNPADPSLVLELERQAADAEISKGLRDLLSLLKGPFVRTAHSFYDVRQVEVVNAIRNLEYEHPVAVNLRRLVEKREGPFEINSEPVLVSVPAGVNIGAGRGASCRSSKFHRQEVKIFNKARGRSISVFVSASFPCPEEDEGLKSLIQISRADMLDLVGDSSIDRMESAYAEPIVNE